MAMADVERINGPLLDVVEELLNAHNNDVEPHGWLIVHNTKRAGPTVYRVLDKLEDAGWVTARWEEPPSDPDRPRRRFYRFTPTGLAKARTIMAERRLKSATTPRLTPRRAFGGRLSGLWGGAR
jgi:hypothetical protein